MDKKIEFKSFSNMKKKIEWQFSSDRPIGQLWRCTDGFCTNGMGEGFQLHGGTKMDEIHKLIDAINKRDEEIAKLKDAKQKDSEVKG